MKKGKIGALAWHHKLYCPPDFSLQFRKKLLHQVKFFSFFLKIYTSISNSCNYVNIAFAIMSHSHQTTAWNLSKDQTPNVSIFFISQTAKSVSHWTFP